MVAAARKLLDAVTLEQASRLSYAVDAPEWQSWANPEFMQHDTGLRLDELDAPVRDAVFAVVEAIAEPGRLRAGARTSCGSTASSANWWSCRC